MAGRLDACVRDGESVCVALSGGLDSAVLLDLLAQCAPARNLRLAAIHVHHGLSPNADAWADFCRALCAGYGIPLDVERVRVDRASPLGLEAAARAARYAAYAGRPEDFVALAHHRDDQAETLLVQLLRGTGMKGAAAMPEVRGLPGARVRLFRPLLALPRARLREHAEARGVRWIEDESNDSGRHDRNYVRHEIAPRLDARFPRWREAAARFSRHAAATEALLGALARLDGLSEGAADLAVAPGLDEGRRANLLRAFLDANGVPMPSEARLADMARQLFAARGDARVRIETGEVSLVRFRDRIRIERIAAVAPWRRPWHGELEADLESHGRVRFERVRGEGIAASRTAQGGWHFAGRAGGERLRVDARRPNRTLKNLLREHDVPPWERERLPLLFHGDRLVWVPGVGVAAEYACPPGEPGLRPEWVPKGPRR